MNKLAFFFAAVFLTLLPLSAQEADDSGFDSFGNSVLDTARDEYQGQDEPEGEQGGFDQEADYGDDTEAAPEEQSDRPYAPFILSFVPGISTPVGIWDSSIALGAIGSAAGTVDGIQASGIFSMAAGINGVQASGVFNMAEHVFGVQAAGVFNMANRVEGVMAAGVFNIAGDVEGLMTAGIFNIAGNVEGVMLGWINVADSVDGATIGLLNFVENGVGDLSAEYQLETGLAYLVWRGGSPSFYTSFYAGADGEALLDGRLVNPSFGLGIGSRTTLAFLELDTELCLETVATEANFQAANEALWNPANLKSYPWESSFLAFRASLALGHGAMRPVAGIKADIAVDGAFAVPEYQKTGLAGVEGMPVQLFDLSLRLWTKWFLGLRLDM